MDGSQAILVANSRAVIGSASSRNATTCVGVRPSRSATRRAWASRLRVNWLGGWVVDSGFGPRAIYAVAALTTVASLALAGYALRRDSTVDDRAGESVD